MLIVRELLVLRWVVLRFFGVAVVLFVVFFISVIAQVLGSICIFGTGCSGSPKSTCTIAVVSNSCARLLEPVSLKRWVA